MENEEQRQKWSAFKCFSCSLAELWRAVVEFVVQTHKGFRFLLNCIFSILWRSDPMGSRYTLLNPPSCGCYAYSAFLSDWREEYPISAELGGSLRSHWKLPGEFLLLTSNRSGSAGESSPLKARGWKMYDKLCLKTPCRWYVLPPSFLPSFVTFTAGRNSLERLR